MAEPIHPEEIASEINSRDGREAAKFQQEWLSYVKAQTELAQQVAESVKQNNTERVKYARNIFWLTAIWCACIVGIIIAHGCCAANNKKFLTEPVLITLITTTTLNFFGYFFLVVKYLFDVKQLAAVEAMLSKMPNSPPV